MNDYEEYFQPWELRIAKSLVTEFLEEHDHLSKNEFDDLLNECLSHWVTVKRILESYDHGCEISLAESGEVCLNELKRAKYDLIISDYQMPPGMNGLELLKKLRKDNHGVAFIMLTGHKNRQLVREAFAHGADDYFVKWDDFALNSRLLTSIKRAINNRLNLKRAHSDTIRVMKAAIEIYHPPLKGHSSQVSRFSGNMAKLLGWL